MTIQGILVATVFALPPLTTQHLLILTAAVIAAALIYVIACTYSCRAMLREQASILEDSKQTYLNAPPELRFRLEMKARESNVGYQRFLKTDPRGREWDARIQQFLESPQGRHWKERYESKK